MASSQLQIHVFRCGVPSTTNPRTRSSTPDENASTSLRHGILLVVVGFIPYFPALFFQSYDVLVDYEVLADFVGPIFEECL